MALPTEVGAGGRGAGSVSKSDCLGLELMSAPHQVSKPQFPHVLTAC